MVGRQFCALTLAELLTLSAEYGFELNQVTSAKLHTVANGWSESLGAEVVESMDAAGHEQATIIHDMNLPIPDHSEGQIRRGDRRGNPGACLQFPGGDHKLHGDARCRWPLPRSVPCQ